VGIGGGDSQTLQTLEAPDDDPCKPRDRPYPGPVRVGIRGFAFAVLVGLAMSSAATADARLVYVAGTNGLVVMDTASDQVLGKPIPVKGKTVAVTPDGSLAAVAGDTNHVSIVDTASRAVGKPVTVSGSEAEDVAITPDGRSAYVSSEGGLDPGWVTTIDLASGQVVGEPVKLKHGAGAIAIAPNSLRAFVATYGSSPAVSEAFPQVGAAGRELKLSTGVEAWQLAVTPDGKLLLATGAGALTVIDTNTFTEVGSPIEIPTGARGLAISPDGHLAYVGGSEAMAVVDIASHQVVDQIPLPAAASVLALTPSGEKAYAAGFSPGVVTATDLNTGQVVGGPVKLGGNVSGVAVAPDQSPVASFTAPPLVAGTAALFDGGASSDRDGAIAGYAWSFGDGVVAPDGGRAISHTFAAPGIYDVSLTVTDDEGCSDAFVFTGHTAYCNGLPSATQTQALVAARGRDGVALAAAVARVRKGRALLRLRCRGIEDCRGVLRLVARTVAPGKGRPRRGQIGRARFALDAGETRTLRVRLSRKGLKVLGSTHRHRLTARVAGRGVRHRAVLLTAVAQAR
jgi:DNA-binding beta-propeller fold protein YncE